MRDTKGRNAEKARALAQQANSDLAKIPEQMGIGIGQMFEALKPNPQLVADAIVILINTPAGKRPLRTVVDDGGPVNRELYAPDPDLCKNKLFNSQGSRKAYDIQQARCHPDYNSHASPAGLPSGWRHVGFLGLY